VATESVQQLLARRFKADEWMIAAAVADFSAADWLRAAGDGAPALWILGHIVTYRRVLLRTIGGDIAEEPWESAFARGSDAGSAAQAGIDADGLMADLNAVGEKLRDQLAGMTDADLAAAGPRELPDGSTTIVGLLSFMQFHESYHLGQLGYLRRVVGKDGIA
jgi:uncharacterized damage-inducible protein DinB